jgi:hypothetical protein
MNGVTAIVSQVSVRVGHITYINGRLAACQRTNLAIFPVTRCGRIRYTYFLSNEIMPKLTLSIDHLPVLRLSDFGVFCHLLHIHADSPFEAKFWKGNEKEIAIERLRANQMGIVSREWRWDHVIETLLDLKTYCWAVIIICVSLVFQLRPPIKQ